MLLVNKIRYKPKLRFNTLPTVSSRTFWWPKNASSEKEENANLTDHKDSKGLVPMFGESTPKPSSILALPISRRPIFPGFVSSVIVKNPKISESIIKSVESNSGFLGLFMRTDLNNDEIITDDKQLYKVGTFGQVKLVQDTNQGTQLFIMAHRRLIIDEIVTLGPPTIAKVTHWNRPNLVPSSKSTIRAYSNEVISAMRELFKLNPLAQETLAQVSTRIELTDPFKLADLAASITTAEPNELQKVLEAFDVEERLSLTLSLLHKEIEILKLQRDISKQVEAKMTKQQREYLLHEQLKSIKQELGIEKDDKAALINKFNSQIESFKNNINPDVLKVINEEIEKLSSLERNSPEFNVTKAYLEWLTNIPWGVMTHETFDINYAKHVLDLDHYGLQDIKKRILEYVAVGKLKGTVSGKILCFVGPPGVGKTSIAKSIATALNRKFYRFSVGGLTDIAEVKGHRRTYIGAMPGKPILCLKSTGSINPLILIDEVDKVGKGYQGDPASALLELLDPNQNSNFIDHYLDVPVDFSKVLFVCTANDEGTIPGPLRDRMEIIRLSGYDIPEKIAIASRYLIPKALLEVGMTKKNDLLDDYYKAVLKSYDFDGFSKVSVKIPDQVLESLIRNYCRESGVRSLEKQIEKIARKLTYDYVCRTENSKSSDENNKNHHPEVIEITTENLENYVGKPKYPNETLYEHSSTGFPPGIVMGLAWNPLGGSPIYIETTAIPTTPSDGPVNVSIITGQLGNVMKESVNIAYTFSRQFLAKLQPENRFFKENQVHLHVPEGAIEKDGPSAGVAMTTCLLSLALGRPVKPKVAMTGELSLTGKILPVGGIKEKVLAARRAGANVVILPAANKRDYDDLPKYIKDSIDIHFLNDYSDVYKLILEY